MLGLCRTFISVMLIIPAVPPDDCTQNRKCSLTNSTISLFSRQVLKNQIIINIRLLCNINLIKCHLVMVTNSCHTYYLQPFVILLLLRCTVLVSSLRNTPLIMLEIFAIDCCTVLVKPAPMTSSLFSFVSYKYVKITLN